MASSTHNLYGGATAAPPPTPSTQPNNPLATSDAADALSKLFHRLPPPTLSLPTRRTPPATCPPILSLPFNDTTTQLDGLLSASLQLGFFQLTDHTISSQLAHSAESDSLALFDLPKDKKESWFPKNWPLGYEADDDNDDEEEEEEGLVGLGESFRLDSSCSTESSTELSLDSLREFSRALEKVGLRIVELLCNAVGFENPIGEDPTRFCSMMWISECVAGNNKPIFSGGFYPYIVGLQYQIRCQKYSLMADSGWVSVLPQVDTVMITLGDIAHVWSNGKLKKVRGRPVAQLGDTNNTRCISMTLLVTLPTDSTISPLLPKAVGVNEDEIEKDKEHGSTGEQEERLFNSFSFEDYAWRVYHERLLFKDPLDRYRI